MKKVLIYLSIIIVLFAALYFVNQKSEDAANSSNNEAAQKLYNTDAKNLNPLTRDQLDDENYQDIIVKKDLDKKLANKETFFAYFFSPACSHCVATTPVVAPIINDLNAEWKQFNLLENPNGYDQYNIEYTPTIVYFKDGVEVDRVVGEISNSSQNTPAMIKSWFEKHMAEG